MLSTARLAQRRVLTAHPERFYRKTVAPGFYNLRFRPSQGNDGNYVHNQANFTGPEGYAPHQTNRDPTAFKFTNNLFSLDYWEWRTRAGDYLYNVTKRLHRSNDGWTRTLVGYTTFCFLMANQALFWKLHLFFFSLFTATRIRDRGVEPTLDEVWLFDTLLANEKVASLFSSKTWHVMDYNQEWDKGLDNPYFPEYKTTTARFFNTDCNTTSGFYKFGDVESGATMTLNFKTMPYANNKYNLSEPYYVYDMYADIAHNGQVHRESLIKAEKVLKTKRIFVSWH